MLHFEKKLDVIAILFVVMGVEILSLLVCALATNLQRNFYIVNGLLCFMAETVMPIILFVIRKSAMEQQNQAESEIPRSRSNSNRSRVKLEVSSPHSPSKPCSQVELEALDQSMDLSQPSNHSSLDMVSTEKSQHQRASEPNSPQLPPISEGDLNYLDGKSTATTDPPTIPEVLSEPESGQMEISPTGDSILEIY